MGKVSLFGILSVFGSFVLFAFEIIGKTLNNTSWQNISLRDLLGPDKTEWIASVDMEIARTALEIFFNNSLYVPLFIVGVVLLIISGFAKK